ncbi:hypothetical protein WLW86_14730 [Bordetella bronchiseptica]
MKTIRNYAPPSPAALRRLQETLHYSTAQMNQLAGLDDQTPWPRYIDGAEPHALGRQRLLYMAARLALPEAQWRLVLERMRNIGARFDYDDGEPLPAPGAVAPEPVTEVKFGITLSSLSGAFHEMEQLREFAHFAHEAGVDTLVARAWFGRDDDICRFEPRHATPAVDGQQDRLFEAAARAIGHFEFGGRIYQGGLPTEPD